MAGRHGKARRSGAAGQGACDQGRDLDHPGGFEEARDAVQVRCAGLCQGRTGSQNSGNKGKNLTHGDLLMHFDSFDPDERYLQAKIG